MYTASLKSCVAKVNRAEEHRQALHDYVGSLFESERNRATLRADADGETGYHIISLQTVPDLSRAVEEISVRVGDIAHNLRSALDHLVWQLACLNTNGNPLWPRRIQFPIEDDPAKFQSRCTPGTQRNAWLGEVDPTYHTIIERFQPYHGMDNFNGPSQQWWSGYVHELALLRDLSDLDKHRLLVTVVLPTTGFEHFFRVPKAERGLLDWDFNYITDHTMKIGAKLMRARLSPGPNIPHIEAHMDMVGYATPSISFERGGPVVPNMQRIENFVLSLLDTFEKVL
jgi:hypothetical protein